VIFCGGQFVIRIIQGFAHLPEQQANGRQRNLTLLLRKISPKTKKRKKANIKIMIPNALSLK
jgi:hypothetical protein